MGHAYFSNLGNKVMTLPDSKCSPQPIDEFTMLVPDELTRIVISATSIFSLPEIQLEKEIVRPAVTPDPGDITTPRHTQCYQSFCGLAPLIGPWHDLIHIIHSRLLIA